MVITISRQQRDQIGCAFCHKIIEGWWTDLENNKIKRSYFGEKVRFHISTSKIEDGEIVELSFYDDDGWNDTQLGSSAKRLVVNNNRGYVEFDLRKDWEGMADSWKEAGGQIELYATAKYKGINQTLPSSSSDYLQVYRRHKVILIFYHGGPFESGQQKTVDDDTGYTGVLYQKIKDYVDTKVNDVVGTIIAPAVIAEPGISTGHKFYKKHYKNNDQVIIYGYSYGGDNAVNLSERISSDIDTLVIVDSSDGPLRGVTVDTSVPSNVDYTLNIYQRKASGRSSRVTDIDSDDPDTSEESSSDGSSNTMGSRGFPHSSEWSLFSESATVENIDYTRADVTHGNIQDKASAIILEKIQARIDAYVHPK